MRKQTPEERLCQFCRQSINFGTTPPRRIDRLMSVILHLCGSARFDFIDGELVVHTGLQQGKGGRLTNLPAEREADDG